MKLELLKRHTHWGKALWRMKTAKLDDESSQDGNQSIRAKAQFADKLWRRIKSFLKAEPDPFMPKGLKLALREPTGR